MGKSKLQILKVCKYSVRNGKTPSEKSVGFLCIPQCENYYFCKLIAM